MLIFPILESFEYASYVSRSNSTKVTSGSACAPARKPVTTSSAIWRLRDRVAIGAVLMDGKLIEAAWRSWVSDQAVRCRIGRGRASPPGAGAIRPPA